MKVKELIDKLQELNPELEIYIPDHYYWIDENYGQPYVARDSQWVKCDLEDITLPEKGKVYIGY